MTLLGQVPSFDQIGRMLDDLVQRNDISEATRDEVLSHHPDELGQAVSDVLDYRPSTSRLEILQEEFTALRRAAVHGAPPVPPAPGVTHHFEVPRIGVQIVETAGVRLKVVPVTRLTVIMAQVGYRRLDPQNGRLVDISHQADGQVWYPGVELRGEGIFIEAAEDLRLDGSSVADWLELYDGGSQGYEPHLFSDASQPVEMSPLFVWWHSLAHRLITALAVDSGYSAAAIRERVYLHEDRGGILLYSSQAAGDGTYGGLIGLLPEMDRIIRLALQDVEVCSNDPFCADIRIRSGGHLGAACFACVMVSETSCEHRNMWLDRRVLVENRGRWDPMILVTGGAWTHLGHRTVDAVMEELLAQARRDVVMTVYLATATREFAKHVTGLLERGVEVRLIFNDWTGLSPTLRGGLSELALRFEGLRLFQFVDPEGRGVLHAKAVSVDSIKAIVGSANLSRAGMLWNYEMGVLLEGPDAEEVSRLLYGLISSDKIREVWFEWETQ